MIIKRNILITGATGAIGKATVTELNKHNDLNLILVGRNAVLLNQLKDDLQKTNASNSVDVLVNDLSELKSAKHVIDLVTQRYSALFAFVNLAAIIKRERTLTSENIETMFATNYLSPFYLATSLANFYKGSLKVIFVTSASTSKIDFANLNGEAKFSAIPNFSQSKTCNVLFIKKISRLFSATNLTALGFDPGIVKSAAMNEMPKFFQIIGRIIGKSPGKSAKSLVEIIMNSKYTNGNFFDKNLKQIQTSNYSENKALQDKLYDLTNTLIKTKMGG